jgi:hypothetical protein
VWAVAWVLVVDEETHKGWWDNGMDPSILEGSDTYRMDTQNYLASSTGSSIVMEGWGVMAWWGMHIVVVAYRLVAVDVLEVPSL